MKFLIVAAVLAVSTELVDLNDEDPGMKPELVQEELDASQQDGPDAELENE